MSLPTRRDIRDGTAWTGLGAAARRARPMTRFLTGLSLGAIAGGAVYGATGSKYLAIVATAATAAGVWTWPLIRAELTDQT